jgi:hypothetical protein
MSFLSITQPVDIYRSIQYVVDHGSLLERARMVRILTGAPPAGESYRRLFSSQNADGGFPSRPKPGSHSSTDSTITSLWQMDELGLLESEPARRALDFLMEVQRPDGGLDENAALPEFDLPPWIRPGELPTRTYLTSHGACWFAARRAGRANAFGGAVAYLAAQQLPDGRIPGYMHANFLAAAAFLQAGPGFAGHAQHTLEFLLMLRRADWFDSHVAWALDSLLRAGLDADHPLLRFLLRELIARQGEDGAWAVEDGPDFAASATVAAIKVLHQLGLTASLD